MIDMDDSQASKLMSRLETLPQEEQSQFKRIVLATALAFLAADEHKPRLLLLLHNKEEDIDMITILSAFAGEMDALDTLEAARNYMTQDQMKDAPPKEQFN